MTPASLVRDPDDENKIIGDLRVSDPNYTVILVLPRS
jgi:hypothetical protein